MTTGPAEQQDGDFGMCAAHCETHIERYQQNRQESAAAVPPQLPSEYADPAWRAVSTRWVMWIGMWSATGPWNWDGSVTKLSQRGSGS